MATRLKPTRINVDNVPQVGDGASYQNDNQFHWSLGGGDMEYEDFEWVTLSGSSLTLSDISSITTPSSNFSISVSPGTLKPGIVYKLRVNTGSTPYTMTLGTGVTNPNGYSTELKPNTVNQFDFIATSDSQLELQLPDLTAGDVKVSTDTGNNLTTGAKIWLGTEAACSAITTKDSNTMYIQYVDDTPSPGWQPGPNTIAYYKLESNLDDYSGNGYDLTAASTVTYSQLASGKNVCFFNDKASVSNFPAFTGDITFSFWVRNSSNYTSYNNVGYVLKGNSRDDAGTTAIIFSGTSQGNGFRRQPTGSLISRPSIFTDTNWHYVVCTYNRSTQLAEVYLDGNTTPAISFTNTSYASASASVFSLCEYVGSQKKTYLSEVIIEDKVRTAGEISNYYDQTKGDYGIS